MGGIGWGRLVLVGLVYSRVCYVWLVLGLVYWLVVYRLLVGIVGLVLALVVWLVHVRLGLVLRVHHWHVYCRVFTYLRTKCWH